MSEQEWNNPGESLPPIDTLVLGWSEGKYCLCSWFPREDFPHGQHWEVNGKSGGIGTHLEVKRPEAWCFLPHPPKVKV